MLQISIRPDFIFLFIYFSLNTEKICYRLKITSEAMDLFLFILKVVIKEI